MVLKGADSAPLGRHAGLRQEHPGLEGARREHAARLGDERRAAAALERLPGAPGGARAGPPPTGSSTIAIDPGGVPAVQGLLDEPGLPDPEGQVPAGRPLRRRRRPRPTRPSPRWWSTRSSPTSAPGQRFKLGQRVEVKGIAWDGGYGIQGVEVSTDGGRSWRPAELGAGPRAVLLAALVPRLQGRPARARRPSWPRPPTGSARPRLQISSSTRPATTTTWCSRSSSRSPEEDAPCARTVALALLLLLRRRRPGRRARRSSSRRRRAGSSWSASCNACHSLDYIPMNSPFLDRKGWEGSVTKMIKVMKAPISPGGGQDDRGLPGGRLREEVAGPRGASPPACATAPPPASGAPAPPPGGRAGTAWCRTPRSPRRARRRRGRRRRSPP